jgi:signal transduction histidine kinase/CHASE3 domain sensor protein
MSLSSRTTTIAAFTLALLLLAATGLAGYFSTIALVRSAEEVRRTHEVLNRLEAVLARLTEAEAAQRGYVITGDPAYLSPYSRARGPVGAELEALRVLLTDDAQRARLDELTEYVDLRLALIDTTIMVRTDVGFEAAAARVQSGEGRARMEEIRQIGRDFERHELALLERRQADADGIVARTKATIAFSGLFGFVALLGSMFALLRDLSARRQIEHALREREAMLQQFLERLPAGAVVIDTDARIRYANSAARALLGPGTEDGASFVELAGGGHFFGPGGAAPFPPERFPTLRALERGSSGSAELELRGNGTVVPLRVSAAVIRGGDERITHAISVFYDVSDEKRVERALRAAKEEAEHASRSKSEFLARMSHELRTPLNSVIGFANILRRNRSDTLDRQDLLYLERIAENGMHLLGLINDILDLSKIEAGKLIIEPQPVELGDLVAGVAQQWPQPIRDGAVRLETHVPDDIEPVLADPGRLRQVLLNLIDNAVKFTEHGAVRVSVEACPGTRTAARIRVSDTGIGIPPDRLAAVFESFEQAESSTSRNFGGTGLGLPISRALCELMGFRLTATSEAGRGSEFVVEL